jgi:hypothetical protein
VTDCLHAIGLITHELLMNLRSIYDAAPEFVKQDLMLIKKMYRDLYNTRVCGMEPKGQNTWNVQSCSFRFGQWC